MEAEAPVVAQQEEEPNIGVEMAESLEDQVEPEDPTKVRSGST